MCVCVCVCVFVRVRERQCACVCCPLVVHQDLKMLQDAKCKSFIHPPYIERERRKF